MTERIVRAAGGQHEVHSVLRSLARDEVNKNSSEPKAAQGKTFSIYDL
jgi:hypothetical protein